MQVYQPGKVFGLHHGVAMEERCDNRSRQSWGDFEVIS
jgi:hypothetical protein